MYLLNRHRRRCCDKLNRHNAFVAGSKTQLSSYMQRLKRTLHCQAAVLTLLLAGKRCRSGLAVLMPFVTRNRKSPGSVDVWCTHLLCWVCVAHCFAISLLCRPFSLTSAHLLSSFPPRCVAPVRCCFRHSKHCWTPRPFKTLYSNTKTRDGLHRLPPSIRLLRRQTRATVSAKQF